MKARYLIAAVALIAVPAAVYAQSTGDHMSLDCDGPPVSTGVHLSCTVTDYQPAPTSSSSTTTSTSSTTVPVTTTTAPATTTTLPATTTTHPATTTTSTTSSTTTTTSPPVTVPPAGVVFSDDFSNPASFANRYVYDVGNYIDGTHTKRTGDIFDQYPWIDTPRYTFGDHDMACGDPATTDRQLDNDIPASQLSQYFWQCAPGGDNAKAHLMTGFDTTGYTVVSFSPNQTLTNVTKVCWDVNATDEGGGKWTNMIIVPQALYQQFAPRMDYVRFDFNNANAPGDFNIQQSDHPATRFLGVTDFRGTQFVYNGDQELAHPGGDTAHVTTDKAARYQHCLTKTSATTARLTVARPGGDPAHPDTFDVTTGAAWPTGPVRVIFQDEMYDPPKRAGYDPTHVTWHWDNITISGG